MEPAQTPTVESSPFLSLPTELRQKIYQHITPPLPRISFDGYVLLHFSPDKPNQHAADAPKPQSYINLLQVCKQLSTEFSQHLYSRATFYVSKAHPNGDVFYVSKGQPKTDVGSRLARSQRLRYLSKLRAGPASFLASFRWGSMLRANDRDLRRLRCAFGYLGDVNAFPGVYANIVSSPILSCPPSFRSYPRLPFPALLEPSKPRVSFQTRLTDRAACSAQPCRSRLHARLPACTAGGRRDVGRGAAAPEGARAD